MKPFGRIVSVRRSGPAGAARRRDGGGHAPARLQNPADRQPGGLGRDHLRRAVHHAVPHRAADGGVGAGGACGEDRQGSGRSARLPRPAPMPAWPKRNRPPPKPGPNPRRRSTPRWKKPRKPPRAQSEALNARLEKQLQDAEAQITQARASAMSALRQVATETAINGGDPVDRCGAGCRPVGWSDRVGHGRARYRLAHDDAGRNVQSVPIRSVRQRVRSLRPVQSG